MPVPARHPLKLAGREDRAVAHAVLVLELALEDVGDDLHVLVRMAAEALARRDAVFVHHAQAAEPHVGGIVVGREGECVVGVEPAVVGVAAFVAFADGDHVRTPASGAWCNCLLQQILR